MDDCAALGVSDRIVAFSYIGIFIGFTFIGWFVLAIVEFEKSKHNDNYSILTSLMKVFAIGAISDIAILLLVYSADYFISNNAQGSSIVKTIQLCVPIKEITLIPVADGALDDSSAINALLDMEYAIIKLCSVGIVTGIIGYVFSTIAIAFKDIAKNNKPPTQTVIETAVSILAVNIFLAIFSAIASLTFLKNPDWLLQITTSTFAEILAKIPIS